MNDSINNPNLQPMENAAQTGAPVTPGAYAPQSAPGSAPVAPAGSAAAAPAAAPQGNPKLRPWQGVIVQAGFLALFLTAGAWMQDNWGRVDLITSELMFLVAAVIYCLARRVKLKEMFPVHKITVSDFFGTVILGAAGFGLSLVTLGISLVILPNSAREVATSLNEFLYGNGTPYLFLIFIAAFMPALCEEAMERGAVMSHFRSIKQDWIIVLIMGVFFGIMHMSALRFLSTATLGAILSYIVVKRNNILLSMMLHFLHNGFTLTISYLATLALPKNSATAVDVSSINSASTLGVYMILGFAAPVLLVCGMMLLDRKNHKPIRFAYAGCASALMLVVGALLTVSSFLR